MTEFFYMGGYGSYVWSAYGLSLVVLAVNVIVAHRRNRIVRREVREYASKVQ